MGYLVIARKWRPQSFEEVIGQEHVTVTLQNAIKKDRIASAYLFSGPRGVGKTTTARILAKALNCEIGPTPQPCNQCVPCREIGEGRSIDVLEIDGASNRGIDEVRSLRESTRYTPSNLRYKIYIIDEVHMLTTEAFNALLKTLEEPPPHVVFIFATTEVNKVPATILSRCQRFDFRRIAFDRIVQQLRTICDAENIQVDDSSLYLIARKSEGCMRDSQSLLDQVLSFCGDTVTETDVLTLLGIIQQDEFFHITDALADRNLSAVFDIARNLFTKGYDFNEVLVGLAEHLHNILVLKSTGSRDHLAGLEPYHERYEAAAERFNELDLVRMLQLVNEATHSLRRSANPQIQFETLLARLASMPTSESLQSLFEQLHELKKKVKQPVEPAPGLKIIPELSGEKLAGGLFARINGGGQNAQQAKGNGMEDNAPAGAEVLRDPPSLQEIEASWGQIIETVKKKSIHIGTLLEEGLPLQVQDGFLDIGFEESRGFHIHTIKEHHRLVEHAIFTVTGRHARVRSRGVTDLQSWKSRHADADRDDRVVHDTSPAVPAADSDSEPEDTWLAQYPIAQKLLESLGGEPVGGA